VPVTIDPDNRLRKLGAAFGNPSNRRTAAARAAAQHLSLIQNAFAGGGVDPLSGTSGFWPAKADGSPSVLQDTGRLLGGISFEVKAGQYEIGPEPLPYAPVHQFGDPERNIPQRAFIVMPIPWRIEILTTYAEELTRLAAESVR